MTGMEHIMYRHSAGSGFANVSRLGVLRSSAIAITETGA